MSPELHFSVPPSPVCQMQEKQPSFTNYRPSALPMDVRQFPVPQVMPPVIPMVSSLNNQCAATPTEYQTLVKQIQELNLLQQQIQMMSPIMGHTPLSHETLSPPTMSASSQHNLCASVPSPSTGYGNTGPFSEPFLTQSPCPPLNVLYPGDQNWDVPFSPSPVAMTRMFCLCTTFFTLMFCV